MLRPQIDLSLCYFSPILKIITMSINETTNDICGICANESLSLYHCNSCQAKSRNSASTNELICAFCIGFHLRCNHHVTDQKGSKPLVCPTHKMLQHEYCRTCDSAICWGCMSKHSGHNFSSLDDRASELKPKVFECLSQLENEEKLMNAAKNKIVDTIKKHEEEQKTLREMFLAEIEKIKEKGLKTIDENCSLMKEHLKALDDVTKLQQKLRDLKSVLGDQIWYCWHNQALSKVWKAGQKLFLEDVTIDNSGSVSYLIYKAHEFNEEITHCFSFISASNDLTIVFLTKNKTYLFNPSDANMTLSTVPYPNKTHFLWPYYVHNQKNQTQPHWAYWEGGVIRFTHNSSFTVQCESIPSVRMGQHVWCWLFFISSDNSVIVADIHNNRDTRFTIPDIERISCVSFNYNALFIFSADGTYFYTVYCIQDFKLSEPVKHNWDNQSNVITVNNHSITKAANPSDHQHPYLFKVTSV
ncbi:uncharacterized protein LOC142349868 isoform X3 [Convolutriloba macropyga]|uniref:uncharacterized protein LOC142349868 isoform X3 n=1 Tax=Convolutriloba macropyga TaxID=536237 RepID=UPI003F527273